MNWVLLALLTLIAVGDLARSSPFPAVDSIIACLIFVVSALVAGEMARARQRSAYAWVGWAIVFGPLVLPLLLVVGRKTRIEEAPVSN